MAKNVKQHKKIVTIITAITGDRVVVGEDELHHALKHFILPTDIFLEFLERILKDPSDVFADREKAPREYYMFYRLEDKHYVVAVVKKTTDGAFFASMYPTGEQIRPKHKKLKRIKI